MGIVWSVSLLFASGVGEQIHIYEKAEFCGILYAFYLLIKTPRKQLPSMTVILFSCVILIYHQMYGYFLSKKLTLDYIFAFLIVYIFSKQKVTSKMLILPGVLYGGLGMAVLLIYNFATAFSGWNSNSIGMIAFFSFIFFIATLSAPRKIINKIILIIFFIFYYILLIKCESRGAVLYSGIAFLGIYKILPFYKLWKSKKQILLSLLLPLIIAILVCLFSANADMSYWNNCSLMLWNKTLFNGRDVLWEYGFSILSKYPLLGSGDLGKVNWHNSAVTCLVAYGFLGYCVWIFVFYQILNKARYYMNDRIVYVLFVCFVLIYWQQTVELGFIASKVFLIPYAFLGLLLGRVYSIKKNFHFASNN